MGSPLISPSYKLFDYFYSLSYHNKESPIMKLSFLGKSYEASNTTVDGIETQETLTFLGCHYNRKDYLVANHSKEQLMLTFMGRQYVR